MLFRSPSFSFPPPLSPPSCSDRQEVGAELASGGAPDWGASFRAHAEAHAAAVSPVSGFVLARHVFGDEATAPAAPAPAPAPQSAA